MSTLVRECLEMFSTCSNCAERHKTAKCTHLHKTRCESCKSDDHASWSRDCLTLLRRVEDFNDRNPENILLFFPTADPWSWSIGNVNPSQPSPRHNTHKKATTKKRQQAMSKKPPGIWDTYFLNHDGWQNLIKLDAPAHHRW